MTEYNYNYEKYEQSLYLDPDVEDDHEYIQHQDQDIDCW